MKNENIKQIIVFLRSSEYEYNKTHYNDYSNEPRPTYNFLIMRKGSAVINLDGQDFFIEKNDIIWIPKGARYSVSWNGPPLLFSVLHFDFSAAFDPFFNKKTTIQRLNFLDMDALLNDFHYLKTNKKESYMTISVFYRIFSLLFGLIKMDEYKHEFHSTIQPAINYINSHYQEKIQLETLSKLCYISTSRFEHLFKSIMGVSPITYKNNILLQRIQQTLISDKNISICDISNMYGFESTVYFCRLFKKATGLTPTQYRQTNALI